MKITENTVKNVNIVVFLISVLSMIAILILSFGALLDEKISEVAAYIGWQKTICIWVLDTGLLISTYYVGNLNKKGIYSALIFTIPLFLIQASSLPSSIIFFLFYGFYIYLLIWVLSKER